LADGRLANAGHLLFGKLLYFIAILDLINEDLGRFEAGDIMFIDHNGRVTGDIPGDLLLPFLVDEASKSPDVDILAAGHRGLDNAEKGLYGSRNVGFVNSGFFSDLSDNVCLGHGVLFRGSPDFRRANLNAECSNAKCIRLYNS
jgi:hypothetical protein